MKASYQNLFDHQMDVINIHKANLSLKEDEKNKKCVLSMFNKEVCVP